MTPGIRAQGLDWVFFDAGNTLIGLDYGIVLKALAGAGFIVDEMTIRRAERLARRDLDRVILERWHGGTVPRTGWVEMSVWHNFWRHVLELCGANAYDSDTLTTVVLGVTRPASSWNQVDTATLPTLEWLHGRGYRLGIISNSNGSLVTHLAATGLAKHFEIIIDSTEVGVEKPHPEIFREALVRAGGVDASRALYIGDVYAIDVLGAAGAGMHALLFDPLDLWDMESLPKGAPPCKRLQSLAELTGLLD